MEDIFQWMTCTKGNKLLAGRISRFGGFIAIRNLCYLEYSLHCGGPKHSKTEMIAEYKTLCIEKNVFLNYKELIRLGKTELSRSIKHYCGMYRIRKLTRLTLKKTTSPKEKQFEFSVVLNTFKKLSIQKRQFFSKNDFLLTNRKEMAWFIQNNGGYRKFQLLSGLNVNKFRKSNQRKSLESYFSKMCLTGSN